MRKRIVGIILILCTLCSCSRHRSQGTRINLEHSQAIAYYVDDDKASDHSEKQLHGGSYQNMAPYNMDSIFGDVYTCPPVLALIEITDVNNIELLYRFDQFKIPPKEDDDNAYLLQNSVVSARVEIVFFDPREKALQPDDEITIYSTNSVYDDHGFPVLCKGDRYYITMTDTSLL